MGNHLLRYGKLRDLLNSAGIEVDDYDNNNGLLTRSDGVSEKSIIDMPGNNTNPNNLAEFFDIWPEILNVYDTIMFKSCYPNSHIRDKTELDRIENSYKSILNSFSDHHKSLIIITTPPLRPMFTNKTEAELANDLADWVIAQAGDNVDVFDLHRLYSEDKGQYIGMLKREYRRIVPFDNHPNAKAHKIAAPLLAQVLVNKLS